jgi:hypothetical protein
MSTKTIYKRIALVAVTALGAGVLSVAPAQAAETAATDFSIMSSSAARVDAVAPLTSTLTYAATGLTLTATGGTPFAATDVGRGIWTDEFGYLGTIATYTSSTVVALGTAPTAASSGTSAAIADTETTDNWWLGSPATTVVADGITTGVIKGMTVTAGLPAALNLKFDAATNDDVSKVRLSIGGTVVQLSPLTAIADHNKILAFTAPVAAGTYEAVVSYAIAADFTAVTTVSKAFTLTVAADSSFSTALTTVYLNDDATKTAQADFTAATDALGATGPSTLNTDAARIFVSTRKANGSVYSGGTLYAYMTGPGQLDIDGTTDVRSESISNDGTHYINVSGDGTSGVGTVNIYIILADGVTKVDLPSKKVSFYGSVAKLTATVVRGIATASTTTGDCGGLTDCTYATLAEKPAVVITATDANGVKIPGLTVTGTTADATIVAASTVGEATGGTDFNGLGSYNASITGGVVVGKTTTVTYSTVVSALVTIKSEPVTIANAGTPATVTWALDKTSYAPGAPVVITVTAKDAAGNAVGDNTYSTLFAGATVLGGAITGSTPAASVELVGGKATYTAYAPGTSGSYVISNKLGASVPAALQGTSLTGTVVVGASAEMSAVTTLINSLIAKINALNKLVIKIQKKVRA